MNAWVQQLFDHRKTKLKANSTFAGLANPWPFRGFVFYAARVEIRRQFVRSRLGATWLVLHPLARAAVFAVVFSEILVVRLPGIASPYAYAVYLMAGMAAWGLFSDILSRSVTIFTEYSGMIKKAPVPHLCIPAIGWCNAVFSHALLVVAMSIMTSMIGSPPGIAWIALIPGAFALALAGAGMGMVLGILNVFKRDVAQIAGIVLQVWFWLTPIVYVSDAIPKKYSWVLDVNPILPAVRIYQDAMVRGRFPGFEGLAVPLLLGGVFAVAGYALLRRASGDMVDAL